MLTTIVIFRMSSKDASGTPAAKGGLLKHWSATKQAGWLTPSNASRNASSASNRPHFQSQHSLSRATRSIKTSGPNAGFTIRSSDFLDDDDNNERIAALSSPTKIPGSRLSSNVSTSYIFVLSIF